MGIQVHFLDAATLEKAKHFDIAIYPGDKVGCDKLNSTNYSSSGPYAGDLVGVYPISIETSEKRGIVEKLPEGNNLVLYFLALESVGNNKNPIAEGCVSGVTLKTGEIVPVEVTLKTLP